MSFFERGANDLVLRAAGLKHHRVRPERKPTDRVDFAETLYWNAAVKTDESGVAKVSFDTSDAVTAFRVLTDAFTSSGALGTSSSTIQSIQPFYVEPKMLGKRIHQIHVKNANMLLATPGGRIEWPRMAQEFFDIGYRGWYVLETGSPTGDIVADTRANIDYVKKTFRIPDEGAPGSV